MDICPLSKKRSRRINFFFCSVRLFNVTPDRVHSFECCTLSVLARFPH